MLRQPHSPSELSEAISVAITGDDPIAVANIAAAVERETIVPGATVALDAPVMISVLPVEDERFVMAEVAGLVDQRSLAIATVAPIVDNERRTIQKAELALQRTGGSTFVSSTGFGGRVQDVTLSGEIHSTPLAEGGGFAIEVNERVIASGNIDKNGFAAFEAAVEDWPRDADIHVLSLIHI